ncbi:MAG: hypothetical protein U1E33_05885 [Rhodospirillales bacterium]
MLFAGWCWLALALLAPPAWLATLLPPRLEWRWRALHGVARLLCRATFMPRRVRGTEHLAGDLLCWW